MENSDEELIIDNDVGKRKTVMFIIIGVLVVFVAALAVYFYQKNINDQRKAIVKTSAVIVNEIKENRTSFLPSDSTSTNIVLVKEDSLPAAIESFKFTDFYQNPQSVPFFNIQDYSLPLNVKIDVLNYYTINRKISLDEGLSSLNENGLAIIDSVLPNKTTDFYSAYNWLADKDLPLLITSDFIIHYHQDFKKQLFKEIEENAFYDNLWQITKQLYESAKNRYETRLAKVGDVNDSILESERLATAYFAVALKLLEPQSTQVGDSNNKNNFSKDEAKRLYFNILPYLKDDAGQEVSLIRAASGVKKSPVFLYERDYKDFIVPAEYKDNDKLYNFYLASTWLNSVFPLVVKDKACVDCLLDKDDSRFGLIAASFIAQDFSQNQDLKNRWALIYKVLSYFKGLRDDLNYLNYDQSLRETFGDNYNLEEIFADKNSTTTTNIEKLRSKLLSLSFVESQGALNKEKERRELGFKFLADYYVPNNYIFSRLSGENIGVYQANKASSSSFTICNDSSLRCKGFGLDIVSVAGLNPVSVYFKENTNFLNYNQRIESLRNDANKFSDWHTSSFWSLLSSLKMFSVNNDGQMQAYAKTPLWQERIENTAVASWVDLQLPFNYPVLNTEKDSGLASVSSAPDNLYIEPNYLLVANIISENEMINGMMAALGINDNLTSVANLIKSENEKLNKILVIIKKELNGEELSADDNYFIYYFARQYQANKNNSTKLNLSYEKEALTEELSLKLMVIIYNLGDVKSMAIGPVWSYTER